MKHLLNKLEHHLNNIIFTEKCKSKILISIKQDPHKSDLVGILEDNIFETYIYKEALIAEVYLQFLHTFLVDYLDENICLARLNNLCFQHDGAPPHNARIADEDLVFPIRVISNN